MPWPTAGSVIPDPQPLKAVLAQRRISNRGLAQALNRTEGYVGSIINGYQAGSNELRARIADLLGLPEEALFRPSEPRLRYPGDGSAEMPLAASGQGR